MKILMVCLGNICRSPLAEGIMRHKVTDNQLNWQVDSAGTGSWHVGAPPDSRSVSVAKAHNIDISRQRGRQFSIEDFDNFDVIYAMDSENYQNINRIAPNQEAKDKVALIMNQYEKGRNQPVPDPYWNDNGFEQVFNMLDHACESIIQNFKDR